MKRARHLFAADPKRKYATVQVELPGVMAAAVLTLGQRISDNVLSFDAEGSGGREERPHITVRYGIESDDPESVREAIESEAPISFSLGAVDVFPASEGAPYDVVFVSCWGDGLTRLNSRISNATACLETTLPYRPHVTLAYVQPGKGWDFIGDNAVGGLCGQVGDVTFVGADGTEFRIPLRSGAIFDAEGFRNVGAKKRKDLAKRGLAMPDGSFPCETEADLKNAIQSVGRAKDPEAVKRFLRRRAKALDLEKLIPEDWGVDRRRSERFFLASVEVDEIGPAPELVELDGVTYAKGKPIHIFPRGQWEAVDGRVIVVTDEDGRELVADANGRPNDIAITYDHEEDKEKGSRAAGWMRAFEWREDGLWATDVLWTLPAWEELKAGEWRYISGDAFGNGNPDRGEPFHPRRILAASLVPKPAIPGLTSIAMSAARTAAPNTEEGAGKEDDMKNKKEICKALGISEDTADEDVLKKVKEMMSASGTTLSAETLDLIAGAVGEQFGAKLFELPGVQERVAAAASAKALEVAAAKAKEQVEGEFAARDREAAIDATLLSFERDGKLTADEREDYRQLFRLDFERAKKSLERRQKVAPGHGGVGQRVDVSGGAGAGSVRVTLGARGSADVPEKFELAAVNDMAPKEREAILTRAAQWQAERGIRHFESALSAVSRGEDIEFRQALARNGYSAHIRPTAGLSDELDGDFLKFLEGKLEKGAIPTNIIPEEIQRFAARRVRQTYTTIASLQAPTRVTLPITVGYASGNKIGSGLLPEFAGVGPNGVNDERVSYPKTGTERFVVLPDRPKGDNDKDIPEGNWGQDWVTVDMKFYSYREWAGRRMQAAGNAVAIDVLGRCTANAQEILALQKENVQSTWLRDTGNFGSNYTTLTSEQRFDQDASEPIAIVVPAMFACWRVCGRFPDTWGMGNDPFWALRKNKSLNELAGKYQATKETPNGLLPIETLIALFGMNLLVSTQLSSSAPGGASPDALWGQDVVLACTGGGETEAPRLGLTVTSPGSPLVRIVSDDLRGTHGSDAAQVTLGYAIGAGISGAGFLLKSASNKIEMPA